MKATVVVIKSAESEIRLLILKGSMAVVVNRGR